MNIIDEAYAEYIEKTGGTVDRTKVLVVPNRRWKREIVWGYGMPPKKRKRKE